MKPDLPIIGGSLADSPVFSMALWQSHLERLNAGAKAIEDRMKIHELRKSAGVEDALSVSVKINEPRCAK